MKNLTRLGRRSATSLCTDDIVWQTDRVTGKRLLVRIVKKDRSIESFAFYTARRLDDGSRCTASFDKTASPVVYIG